MSRSQKQVGLAKRRASAGAKASAQSPKRAWPLRRVVGQVHVEVFPGVKAFREELECGHLIGQAKDMIGERYPARRRCGKCNQGAPRDVPRETSDGQ
jgi:hypothetical protein